VHEVLDILSSAELTEQWAWDRMKRGIRTADDNKAAKTQMKSILQGMAAKRKRKAAKKEPKACVKPASKAPTV
jgi:hypothetical protein